MTISMTGTDAPGAGTRPLVSPEENPLFSADYGRRPYGSLRRAQVTVAEVEATAHDDQADEDDEDDEPAFDVPSVQTFGAVYKMNVQTDRNGAVLVAYSKDAETGKVTRSWLRFDLAGVDYIRARLGQINAPSERCQCARADDPTPCQGPRDAVLILASNNTGSYGCEHHGAQRMASLPGSRPVSHSVAGAAIRVHKAATT